MRPPIPVQFLFPYLCGPRLSTLLLVSVCTFFLLAHFPKLFWIFSSRFLRMWPAQITPTLSGSPTSSPTSLFCFLLQTPSSFIGLYICRSILYSKDVHFFLLIECPNFLHCKLWLSLVVIIVINSNFEVFDSIVCSIAAHCTHRSFYLYLCIYGSKYTSNK